MKTAAPSLDAIVGSSYLAELVPLDSRTATDISACSVLTEYEAIKLADAVPLSSRAATDISACSVLTEYGAIDLTDTVVDLTKSIPFKSRISACLSTYSNSTEEGADDSRDEQIMKEGHVDCERDGDVNNVVGPSSIWSPENYQHILQSAPSDITNCCSRDLSHVAMLRAELKTQLAYLELEKIQLEVQRAEFELEKIQLEMEEDGTTIGSSTTDDSVELLGMELEIGNAGKAVCSGASIGSGTITTTMTKESVSLGQVFDAFARVLARKCTMCGSD